MHHVAFTVIKLHASCGMPLCAAHCAYAKWGIRLRQAVVNAFVEIKLAEAYKSVTMLLHAEAYKEN